MKQVHELEVGDQIAISNSRGTRIATVEKVTKTQITADKKRFDKRSRYQIGGSRWYRDWFEIPTQDQIAKLQNELAEQKKEAHANRLWGSLAPLTADEKLAAYNAVIELRKQNETNL